MGPKRSPSKPFPLMQKIENGARTEKALVPARITTVMMAEGADVGEKTEAGRKSPKAEDCGREGRRQKAEVGGRKNGGWINANFYIYLPSPLFILAATECLHKLVSSFNHFK